MAIANVNFIEMAEVKLSLHCNLLRLRVRDPARYTEEEQKLIAFKVPMMTSAIEQDSFLFNQQLAEFKAIDKKLVELLRK